MYQIINTLHHYNRWLLLFAMLFVLSRTLTGWLSKKSYEKIDNIGAASMLGFAHLQLVLGLILYFALSPVVQIAFNDFGAAMKNADIRYYAVEHLITGIAGVTLIQIGRIKSKKAVESVAKHKTMFIFTSIALLLILSRMPNYDLFK